MSTPQKPPSDPALNKAPPSLQNTPRAIRYTSLYYYKTTKIIWWCALCSLVLDPFIYHNKAASPLDHSLSGFQLLFFVGALLLIARSKLLEVIITVRNLRETRSRSFSRWITIGFVLITVATLFEIGIRISAVRIAPFLGIAAVLIPIALSVRRSWREKKTRDEKLSHDRIFWVETLNRNIFLVMALPIISARLYALTVTLQTPDEKTYLISSLFALVIILASHPSLDQFTVWCSRCGCITSRALDKFGACPRCRPELFFR